MARTCGGAREGETWGATLGSGSVLAAFWFGDAYVARKRGKKGGIQRVGWSDCLSCRDSIAGIRPERVAGKLCTQATRNARTCALEAARTRDCT
mmetsp:Transcript_45017/g.105373  ORF Transcript_45017/g.105373 Transcript_45017/m.105373 type:complete len:94 (+) Transcript_45017:508-789(+)